MNKYQNLLIGLAIGDAFGIGYETLSWKEIRKTFDLTKYLKHPNEGWGNNPGQYTDDTQMSIAIAELLISKKPLTKENFAEYFVMAYKRDERNGYGKGLRIVFPEVSNGKELLSKLIPYSTRNGAAMRATPLGILKNEKEVIDAGIINASVTHDTPSGRASSVCMALAAHYFIYEMGRAEDVFKYCIELTRGIDPASTVFWGKISKMKIFDPLLLYGEADKNIGIPCDGMRTAGAVLYLISNFPDTFTVLKEAILLGGDTDSVAALATGIKAIECGLDSLPKFLLDNLENGQFGREYLMSLGNKLKDIK